MLFNSYTFLFAFLPVVLAGWWGLRGKNTRLTFLTLASWVFYAWWDWRFVPLLVLATALNYAAGLALSRAADHRRRLILIVSISINIALLGYFKYAGFFLDSLNGLGSAVGLPVELPSLNILLPIGISFYTFNSISYTVDVYRRTIEPTRNVVEYSAFVSMFPHLIAGPIVRFTDVAEQLRRPAASLTAHAATLGLFFLGCGLTKKLLIADQLSPTVDRVFSDPGQVGLVAAWAGAIGYSLQLYFDFSGYSDMAVGLAWLLGFGFPQNFDSPYKAVSLTDFWSRWHMTLSRWMRDYLFFPMARRYAVGASSRAGRRERWGTYSCLFLTMVLVGLWHGAAWTFVVWGMIHGIGLASERAYRDHRRIAHRPARLPSRVRTAMHRTVTFVVVVAAFVVFRSPTLAAAGDMLSSMLGLHGVEGISQLQASVTLQFAALLAALLVFVNLAPNTWQIDVVPRVRYGLALGVAMALAIMSIAQVHAFIYFQF